MLTAEQRALATTRSGSRARGRGHINSYWATRSRGDDVPWQKHRFYRAWWIHMVANLIVEQNFAPAEFVLEFWAASIHRLTPRIRLKQEDFSIFSFLNPQPPFSALIFDDYVTCQYNETKSLRFIFPLWKSRTLSVVNAPLKGVGNLSPTMLEACL